MFTKFWLRSIEKKKPHGRPRRRWVDNIKMEQGNMVWGMWTEFIWLRIGSSGRIL
jgi:hypothetical protein